MPYDLESANEVLQMRANFELLPEAFGERCRHAYLAIARNQALQRLVRNDVADAEAKYNELVANGQIGMPASKCTPAWRRYGAFNKRHSIRGRP